MPHLVKYTGAAIADLVSALGFPGGSTLQAALDGYQQRRDDIAKEILLSELKSDAKADWQVANEDAFFGAIHRFRRAATEGAARHNLKLLAQAMRGTLLSGDIRADRFNLFCDRLTGLSRAECWLLGTLHPICQDIRTSGKSTSDGVGSVEMWDRVRAVACPEPYSDSFRLGAALSALARTGLVIPVRLIDLGTMGAETTPLMDDLAELISAEELCAVSRE
jgi:hypothetical protein